MSELSSQARARRVLGLPEETSSDDLLSALTDALERVTQERDALRHRCFSGRGSMTIRVSSPVRNGYGCAPIKPLMRGDDGA